MNKGAEPSPSSPNHTIQCPKKYWIYVPACLVEYRALLREYKTWLRDVRWSQQQHQQQQQHEDRQQQHFGEGMFSIEYPVLRLPNLNYSEKIDRV